MWFEVVYWAMQILPSQHILQSVCQSFSSSVRMKLHFFPVQRTSRLCICAVCGSLWCLRGTVPYEQTDFCWKGNICSCGWRDKKKTRGDATQDQSQVFFFLFLIIVWILFWLNYLNIFTWFLYFTEDQQAMEDVGLLITVISVVKYI